MRYLNWSVNGIWITTAGMVAFVETTNRFIKIKGESRLIEVLMKSPITNLEIISTIMLRGIICGFVQFLFSMLTTSILNHEYIDLINLLFIIIQMLVIISFFAVSGTFIGIIISNNTLFIYISCIIFLIITMGFGTFIPINYYPDSYISVIEMVPILHVIQNVQALISHNSIDWVGFFLTIFATIILLIASLVISYQVFRKV